MRPSNTRRAVTAVVVIALGVLVAPAAQAVPEGPEHPSPEWFAREAANYAKTQEEPAAQAQSPEFQQRWRQQSLDNYVEYRSDGYHNGAFYDSTAGNLCATWSEQCVGEPFLYPGVDPFYEEEGERVPVSYYDRDGALLLGHLWAPRGSRPDDELPGVVIETGSVQAPQTLYWWFARTLVRNGYIVMTYDVRGQGRSDSRSPGGEPGSNFNNDVFVENLVDSVDLFLATPDAPYRNNEVHADVKPGAELASHNPFWERLDQDRLGIIGHSLGASGVSAVQGLEPWIGQGDANPVDVAIAWDNLRDDTTSGGPTQLSYETTPRVPTMGQAADYGLTPTPKTEPPDPEEKKAGFTRWRETGVPSFQIVVQGGTHFEWSYLPTFPSTHWGRPWSGEEGWGNPMMDHYSLAWLDRWLKEPDEPGFADADARLLQDERWCDRLSFYYRSGRAFPDRDGTMQHVEDIRASCLDAAAPSDPSGGEPPGEGDTADEESAGDRPAGATLPATGGGVGAAVLLTLLAGLIRAGRRAR